MRNWMMTGILVLGFAVSGLHQIHAANLSMNTTSELSTGTKFTPASPFSGSGTSFTADGPVDSGVIVGAFSVTPSGWAGALALTGTNAANFTLNGMNLVTAASLPAGSSNEITITAVPAANDVPTKLTFTVNSSQPPQPAAGFDMTATFENIAAGTNYDFAAQFNSYGNSPNAGSANNGQYVGAGGAVCNASRSNPNPGTGCSVPTRWMWSIQQIGTHGTADANHSASSRVLQTFYPNGWTMNGGPGSNPPGAPAGYGSFPGQTSIFLANSPAANVLNLSFDWQWGPGFKMTTCQGGSKFGAAIGFQWPAVGPGSYGYYAVNTINLFYPNSSGVPSSPVNYSQFSSVGLNGSGPPGSNVINGGGGGGGIGLGKWTNVRVQIARGAPNLSAGTGYIKVWENGTLVFSDVTRNGIQGNQAPITIPENATPFVAADGWLGGGNCPATADSYLLTDKVRVWTGTGP